MSRRFAILPLLLLLLCATEACGLATSPVEAGRGPEFGEDASSVAMPECQVCGPHGHEHHLAWTSGGLAMLAVLLLKRKGPADHAA